MTALTVEQTDQIQALYGKRFIVVQQNPDILSRRDRRKLGHRTHYFGRGVRKVPRG